MTCTNSAMGWFRDYRGTQHDEMLRAFARWCARSVLHKWDAPRVVVEWLDSGCPALRDSALSAAQSVAQSSAWDADQFAARPASQSAAQSADQSSAWDGAWDGAWDAAWDAAWSATWSATHETSSAVWDSVWHAVRSAQESMLGLLLRVHEATGDGIVWDRIVREPGLAGRLIGLSLRIGTDHDWHAIMMATDSQLAVYEDSVLEGNPRWEVLAA